MKSQEMNEGGCHAAGRYPLFDVPWLVREANESWMSQKRHEIEVRNQTIVDDYFVARDKGHNHHQARIEVAKKYQITVKRVRHCLRWFYQEAVRRKKYDFLIKFPPAKEHIVHY